MMQKYVADAQSSSDVALQLPTGSGKTLVVLLIGEWLRRKNQERVVFLCPTRQLVNQVVQQAEQQYGLNVYGFVGSKRDFDAAAKADYQAVEESPSRPTVRCSTLHRSLIPRMLSSAMMCTRPKTTSHRCGACLSAAAIKSTRRCMKPWPTCSSRFSMQQISAGSRARSTTTSPTQPGWRNCRHRPLRRLRQNLSELSINTSGQLRIFVIHGGFYETICTPVTSISPHGRSTCGRSFHQRGPTHPSRLRGNASTCLRRWAKAATLS